VPVRKDWATRGRVYSALPVVGPDADLAGLLDRERAWETSRRRNPDASLDGGIGEGARCALGACKEKYMFALRRHELSSGLGCACLCVGSIFASNCKLGGFMRVKLTPTVLTRANLVPCL